MFMEIEFSSANLLGISVVIQWHFLIIIIAFMNTGHNKSVIRKI